MKLALLLLLPAAASFADTCPGGTPLIALDQQGVAGTTTRSISVSTSGAWEVTKSSPQKPPGPRHGCLDKATLDKAVALVDGAPWTVTQKRISCRVAPQTWTEVEIKGKHAYEEKTCGKDVLDDKSAAALAELHKLFDTL